MESPLCPPSDPGFRLIETFFWTPENGIRREARHLARLQRSAEQLGIVPQHVPKALAGIAGACPLRVRVTLDVSGNVEVATQPFAPLADHTVWLIGVADKKLCSDDPWLGVKTTVRNLYDDARAMLPEQLDEFVFLNENNHLCEGAITNIFVQKGQGLLTPPVFCGVLPGVLREELMETGQAREAVLTLADLELADMIYVGNSLRGLIAARLI